MIRIKGEVYNRENDSSGDAHWQLLLHELFNIHTEKGIAVRAD